VGTLRLAPSTASGSRSVDHQLVDIRPPGWILLIAEYRFISLVFKRDAFGGRSAIHDRTLA
jgi:hypothetical protein